MERQCPEVCHKGDSTPKRRFETALLIACLALNFVGLVALFMLSIWFKGQIARAEAYRAAAEAARAIEQQAGDKP
jgi:hypothetical protein